MNNWNAEMNALTLRSGNSSGSISDNFRAIFVLNFSFPTHARPTPSTPMKPSQSIIQANSGLRKKAVAWIVPNDNSSNPCWYRGDLNPVPNIRENRTNISWILPNTIRCGTIPTIKNSIQFNRESRFQATSQ